jgi:hypothetical protein
MSAKDALDSAQFGEAKRALCYFFFHAKPAGIEAIEKAREGFLAAVEFLNPLEEPFAETADERVAADEAVELMSMHRKVADSVVLPHVTLIDGNSNQVRHHVGEALIVIALDPDYLDLTFGIGELADAGEKLPVFAS